jgi:hypothetical protein
MGHIKNTQAIREESCVFKGEDLLPLYQKVLSIFQGVDPILLFLPA